MATGGSWCCDWCRAASCLCLSGWTEEVQPCASGCGCRGLVITWPVVHDVKQPGYRCGRRGPRLEWAAGGDCDRGIARRCVHGCGYLLVSRGGWARWCVGGGLLLR